MIIKISEILEAFLEKEKKEIDSTLMPHMPTLGKAYEELTKEGIRDHIIPEGFNINVESGFVEFGENKLSGQIDCMVILGEGRRYPHTSEKFVSPEQVLCIFEVKKTLNKSEFYDAFEHLRKIRSQFDEYFVEQDEKNQPFRDVSVAKKTFEKITGKPAPPSYAQIENLPIPERILYFLLIEESNVPLFIILGYGGYKTENGLRKIFISRIEEQQKTESKKLGIPLLPSLTIANNFSIVKCTGFPYIATQENQFVPYCSAKANPAHLIIELLWSKISFQLKLKMPWGDDTTIENFAPLFKAEFLDNEKGIGWFYRECPFINEDKKRNEYQSWSPTTLSKSASILFGLLAYGQNKPLHAEINKILSDKGDIPIADAIDELQNSSLFSFDGEHLLPIETKLFGIFEPDTARWILSDNKERFANWCLHEKKPIPISFQISIER